MTRTKHVFGAIVTIGALATMGCKPATSGGSGGASGARDDLLAHLPAACPTGRVFIDWRSFARHPAFSGHVKALEDKISHAMGREERSTARDVLESFRDKGIDPARDIESAGMCIRDQKSVVLGIGGDFEDKDLLKIFVQIAREHGDTKPPPHGEIDGIRYLGDDDVVVAQVVPRVLVVDVAGEPSDLAKMADRTRVAKDWRAAEGTMLWASVVPDPTMKVELSLRADGDDLVLDGLVASEEIRKAHAAEADVRQELAKLADSLQETPLAPLADDLRGMELQVKGDSIRGHLVAPSAHVSKTIERLLQASDADFQRGFRM
ncbi:MAG: hypothetical protein ACHREM_16605 [Polyangiales bacterium]